MQMTAAVLISADEMEAVLDLPAGEFLAVNDLRDVLAGANVHHGLQREVLFQATRPDPQPRRLIVALGTPPVLGDNGRVEMLVDLHEQAPKDATGKRDVHQQRRICDVSVGQLLARLLPPSLGHPGHTVLGNELAAGPGLPGEYGALKGDGIDMDEQGRLFATLNGVCRLLRRGGQQVLAVTPILYIDGDVDRTIGDIATAYDIEIRGDIKAGFSVKSSGNITTNGVIEDARVSARGNLTTGGLLKGGCRVKAQGDITARHIEGREVKCRNLIVANSIIGAKILAIGHITARDIIGGNLACAGSVTCDHLGDPWATPTHIQVGINPYEEALFSLACHERERAIFQLHDVDDHCKLQAQHLRTALTEDPAGAIQIEATLRSSLAERDRIQRLIERCDHVIAVHGNRVERTAILVSMAKVEIKRELHPGVAVYFGPYPAFTVKEMLKATVLFCKDGKVAM